VKKFEINLPITATIIIVVPAIGCPLRIAIEAPKVPDAANESPKILILLGVGAK
jgi:hypothetical protein